MSEGEQRTVSHAYKIWCGCRSDLTYYSSVML
uniref:Uncharacterized protein n=1 Tax=Amphimedon queenslandica TaxID=400682 RepID=A0A1X7VGT8_AMPQE